MSTRVLWTYQLFRGETLVSKKAFEVLAHSYGVKVTNYFGDNLPFNFKEFPADLASKNQTLVFSEVGSHHQNGVAERVIQRVTFFAQAMLHHSAFHWPSQADLQLWSFALEYSVFLWNHLLSFTIWLFPVELFSGTSEGTHGLLQHCRVLGCPVYVLDATLQEVEKIPKWNPRSRRGYFLGLSLAHSSTVGKVLNLTTGHISPQYHVVYDKLFTTVSTGALREEQSPHATFSLALWMENIQTGYNQLDELHSIPQVLPFANYRQVLC
jgi:hypothetical protein